MGGGQSQPVDLIEAAALLAREAAPAAGEIDRDGAVSEELIGRLASAGLMTMGLVPSLGGPGVEVGTMLESIETLGRGDGSTAWLAMIASTTSILSAYLPTEGARTVFAQGTATISGAVIAPRGSAQRASGGYRVSGRWGFASGCRHASWLGGGAIIPTGSEPDGPPQARIMFFPAEQVTILDTWQVSGLRGSGSHDIVVEDLLVPDELTCSLSDRPRVEHPIYLFPVFGLLALGIAAVALGIGRAAIDELVGLAGAKTPTGSVRKLGERPAVQAAIAEAEATLRSAGAFLYQTVEEVSAMARQSGAMSDERRALLRLAATHATTASARVVDAMYGAGGGTAIYQTSPLQRYFRDVHTATQHMMVAPPTLELAGKVLLGVPADTAAL